MAEPCRPTFSQHCQGSVYADINNVYKLDNETKQGNLSIWVIGKDIIIYSTYRAHTEYLSAHRGVIHTGPWLLGGIYFN